VNKGHTEIENRLAALRERRGFSASALAKMVGVSRQAIYAIEAGTYVPNTALGLRLARALSAGVEELFSLPDDLPKSAARPVSATLIASADKPQAGQPVQLCRVDDRLIAVASAPMSAYLPPSDAVVTDCGPVAERVRVRLHQDSNDFKNRLLIAGCDPAMDVLARHARKAGVELVLVYRNSSDSLQLLKTHRVHIAGTHLRDASTGESNVPAVTRLFARGSVAVISFATWQEGLITAHGNPKHIHGVEDLTRRDVLFVNREPGSGSRLLLDTYLARLKLSAKRVRGYDRLASGHLAAAWQVKNGAADCCLATASAARVLGLHFVPLESARYDLCMRSHQLELPAVQALLNTIALSSFRREITGTGGYDTAVTGERVI
jgi:putative molybdopterin biosynthesis protein